MERFLFSRMETWLVILIAVFCIAFGGVWAAAVVVWHVFPYGPINEIRAFVRGAPGDDRSLWLRLTASGHVSGRAFPANRQTEVLPGDAFLPMRAAPGAAHLPDITGMRLASPASGETRYFVAYGSFSFDEADEAMGAIAFDSTGTVYRGWPADADQGEYPGPHIGLAVSPGGVIATNTRGLMVAQDWCGATRWRAPWTPNPDGQRRDENAIDGYDWHHDITWADDAFWSFVGPDIAAVDVETGEIRTRIAGLDMIRWSWRDGQSLLDTRADIFDPRRLTPDGAPDILPADPFHFNKVDVLTEEMAPDYPGLEAGDLLISARDLNLVAILRPSEERFVWWRYGLSSRQHDATFVDGGIEVFDNAPFIDPPAPSIRRIDYDGQRASTVFDLSQFDFLMRRKGNFEHRGNRILVTDDEAGRAIAARLSGEIEMVFENGYTGDGKTGNLQLRNTTEIASEDFARFEASCSVSG